MCSCRWLTVRSQVVKQFEKQLQDPFCDSTPITTFVSCPVDIQQRHYNNCCDWLTTFTLYTTHKLKCPTQPDVPLYLNSPTQNIHLKESGENLLAASQMHLYLSNGTETN